MQRRYHIRHRTTYEYGGSVNLSYNQLRLTPHRLPGQQNPIWNAIGIKPKPSQRHPHTDLFGNEVIYFEISDHHEVMEILSECLVETTSGTLPNSTIPWERARSLLREASRTTAIQGTLFTIPTELVSMSDEVIAFATSSFPAGCPLFEGAQDLMARIHSEFEFDPAATSVSTPLTEVLAGRKGVCQDFAHLGIGCLRSLGLAARYVSGYIETEPPPGKPRLVGADASHAWFSVLDPETGYWLDLDPTNNLIPEGRHVVVGYGRDYADVPPVKGLMVGSGNHHLDVAVDVIPQKV